MKPTIGRIVHFTLADGQVRPALIVRTWPEITAYNDGVNLQIFMDDNAQGNGNDSTPSPMWKTSVQRADEPTPGCWNWPPRE